jgi:hypothetical protein
VWVELYHLRHPKTRAQLLSRRRVRNRRAGKQSQSTNHSRHAK